MLKHARTKLEHWTERFREAREAKIVHWCGFSELFRLKNAPELGL
jgi:hypothetical protein